MRKHFSPFAPKRLSLAVWLACTTASGWAQSAGETGNTLPEIRVQAPSSPNSIDPGGQIASGSFC